MQKVVVPIVGAGVVTENGAPTVNGAATPPAQPTAPPAKQSLHSIRMGQQPQAAPPAEVRGEFDNFGRVKWVQEPVQAQASADDVADVDDSVIGAEGAAQDGAVTVPPLPERHQSPPPATPIDALQAQIQTLTQTVNVLAQAQLRGMQPQPPAPPQAPTPPDITQFDLGDPYSLSEYQRLNTAYIQAAVRHEVNSAMEPHGGALQDAQLNAQYNRVYAQHGQEPNFKERMGAALQLAAKIPGISIPQAFDAVGGIVPISPQQPAAPVQPTAKPARTMTAEEAAQKAAQAKRLPASQGVNGTAEPTLPPALNNVGALGRIMLHNRQSGRARPIGN